MANRPSALRHAQWIGMLVGGICWLALGTLGGLLITATVPRLVGWQPTVVHGDSMSPTIHRGDVVIAKPEPGGLEGVGQIVLFRSPDRPGRTTLHRVYGNSNGWIVTKGDHNRDPDSAKVPMSAVEGRAVLRIPVIGWPMVWLSNGEWLPLALTALGLFLAARLAARAADWGTIPYEEAVLLLDSAAA